MVDKYLSMLGAPPFQGHAEGRPQQPTCHEAACEIMRATCILDTRSVSVVKLLGDCQLSVVGTLTTACSGFKTPGSEEPTAAGSSFTVPGSGLTATVNSALVAAGAPLGGTGPLTV